MNGPDYHHQRRNEPPPAKNGELRHYSRDGSNCDWRMRPFREPAGQGPDDNEDL